MEKLIFENMLSNTVYASKVFPHIRPEYFSEQKDKIIFEIIQSYHSQYGVMPDKQSLAVELSSRRDVPQNVFDEAFGTVENLAEEPTKQVDWLVDKTEEYCKSRAISNAIMDSIKILDDEKGGKDAGSIPFLLSSALAVTFDTSVGLAYDMSIDALYQYYHTEEAKIPFGLEMLDKVTRGGLRKKTLTIFMAGTGGGKTIMMCHLASRKMMEGKNVLYISMEMSEEMITQRVDANLMNINISEIETMGYDEYSNRKKDVLRISLGRLIVKSYPTASASANHFRALLDELKIKQGFVPDIVMIDYLNICASSRLKSSESGSHQYPKAIAEEIRSLAVEYDFACVSATQMNRSGYSTSDPDLTHTSESMGLPVTADMFFALSQPEASENSDTIFITQLKNRFGDINSPRRFTVGLDRSKMKFYDVDNPTQDIQAAITPSNVQRSGPRVPTPPGSASQRKPFAGGLS